MSKKQHNHHHRKRDKKGGGGGGDKGGGWGDQKRSNKPDFFSVPIPGFLITSDPKKEKLAVKDAFDFLNKVMRIMD